MFSSIKLIFSGIVGIFTLIGAFFIKKRIDEQQEEIDKLKQANKIKDIEKENIETEMKVVQKQTQEELKSKEVEKEILKNEIKEDKKNNEKLKSNIDKVINIKDGEEYEITL